MTGNGVKGVLINVCTGMLVVPLSAAPVIPAGGVQVHDIVADAVLEVRFTAAVCAPEHIVWLGAENCTVAAGFTVMVNGTGIPLHKALTGVTVIVAVTGELPVLIAMKAGMFPVPLAASPIEVLLFVHV